MQGLRAGAIDAAVFGASAASFDELLLERLTGAMGSDGGVAGSDPRPFGEGREGTFGQIDFAEYLAVGGLDGREDAVDTLTDDLVGGGVGLNFGG